MALMQTLGGGGRSLEPFRPLHLASANGRLKIAEIKSKRLHFIEQYDMSKSRLPVSQFMERICIRILRTTALGVNWVIG